MSRERILWEGRPASGLLFTIRDALLIPFSFVWLAFAVFWLWSAESHGAPIFFELWGMMFVAIGLFFFVGRFALDAWLRGRTYYALTDQRIIILRSAPFATFTSIELDRLPEVNVAGEGKTRGHIRFGSAASVFGNHGVSAWAPSLDPVPQFLGIANPSAVFGLIIEASRKLRKGAEIN